MTVDELMALLEGCHADAEVRLAVSVNSERLIQADIIGITSSNRLPPAEYVPGQGDREPGTVWILSGETLGTITLNAWNPKYRRLP